MDTGQETTVSLVVPVHNGADSLRRCLEAISASVCPPLECIVVDDCSTDDSGAVAASLCARVLVLKGGPYGPAYARNRAAEVASGEIVFFVDADVLITPDTVSRVAGIFSSRQDIDAVFGSYDENPEPGDLASQYKNLSHHFVHQDASEEGITFWSGCGAIRREVFLAVGGFDEGRYPRPSIEDIELGSRVKAAGYAILLDKQLQVKHLKQWTLKAVLKSDVLDRAIPWTLLILRDRNLPGDLNLRPPQRISAMLLGLMVLQLVVAVPFLATLPVMLIAGVFLLSAGYWRWGEGVAIFQSSDRARIVALLLICATGWVSLASDTLWVIAPLAPLALAILAGRWLRPIGTRANRWFFSAIVYGLVVAFVAALLANPVWLALPFLVELVVILLLNQRLYRFFLRTRGFPFAIAVIPLHLFYYLYSVVAFIAATAIYYLYPSSALNEAGKTPR